MALTAVQIRTQADAIFTEIKNNSTHAEINASSNLEVVYANIVNGLLVAEGSSDAADTQATAITDSATDATGSFDEDILGATRDYARFAGEFSREMRRIANDIEVIRRLADHPEFDGRNNRKRGRGIRVAQSPAKDLGKAILYDQFIKQAQILEESASPEDQKKALDKVSKLFKELQNGGF